MSTRLIVLVWMLFCIGEHNAAEKLKSYNPLTYHVNNVEDFDVDVRQAYISQNSSMIAQISTLGQKNFDIFICVNEYHHAFVLCVPVGNDVETICPDVIKDDPLCIPEQNFCWTFELCYQNVQTKTYKIRKDFNTFNHLQPFEKAFYIGRYESVSPKALQFAALGASPHRYNVLLNDCVEFSKEFCVQLLRYSDNGKELETNVLKKIREASATGLSVEQLSRNVQSSGWLGNSLLNGYLGGIFFIELDFFVVTRYIVFFLYPLCLFYCLRRLC